ncbi:MAG: CDP-diacylglycerol--serine O-phosphatidyltransferase [Rhizobiales bacterium]|nr:CDP-diacylglycerol--serine O-phosphatidyltransferase [Hyphomicrobiales bacterium]
MNKQAKSPRSEKLPAKPRRFAKVPIRFLLPNIITLLAVCSGVTAIRLATEDRYELAVAAVILACLLDALDGRVARMLKGASKFGAELDSLADFVNFGVAPAMLLYMWSLHSLKNIGWIVALALAICCALRLARFNVAIDDPDKPPFAGKFFSGIPAPAGALLAMAPMYLGFLGVITDGSSAAPFVLPFVAAVAAGIVSRIPTFSGKGSGQQISRDKALPIVVTTVFAMILLITYPWEMLTFLSVAYVVMIPVSMRSYHRQDVAWKAQRKAAEPTA